MGRPRGGSWGRLGPGARGLLSWSRSRGGLGGGEVARMNGIRGVVIAVALAGLACAAESKSSGTGTTTGSSGATTTGTSTTRGSGTGGDASTSGPGPAEYCWQYDTQADCDAQGSACEFEGGIKVFANGVCTDDPAHGWCHPSIWGGSATGSVWYDPATGRVKGTNVIPPSGPPGWELCAEVRFLRSAADGRGMPGVLLRRGRDRDGDRGQHRDGDGNRWLTGGWPRRNRVRRTDDRVAPDGHHRSASGMGCRTRRTGSDAKGQIPEIRNTLNP